MHSHRYTLFGYNLCTREDFSHSLLIAPSEESDTDDIRLSVKRQQQAPKLKNAQQIFPAGSVSGRQPASLYIYKGDDCLRIVYLDFAIYDIIGRNIICYPAPQTNDMQLHLNFLGPIMSLWLEQNGFQVLHASAVIIEQKVALFLADSLQGKSTIASMMVKHGYPLVSDDLVPVKYSKVENRFNAYPSYPVIKLWPDQFEHLFEKENPPSFQDEELKKCRIRVDHIKPGLFSNKPYPLAAIYKLCRRDTLIKTSVEPLSRIESVTELIRFSFAAPIMIATGWQPQRLEKFSTLSAHSSVRNLIYASDIENLDSVCDDIINNFTSLI